MNVVVARLRQLVTRAEERSQTDLRYVVSGGFWLNLNFVITSISGLLLSIAYANLLSKEVFGTYQYLLAIYATLTAFTLTGMNTAVTTAVARGNEGALRASVRTQLIFNLLGSAAALAAALYYYQQANLTIVFGLLVMSVAIPLYTTFNTYTAYIIGKKDFKRGFIFGATTTLVYTAAMGIALYLTHNPVVLLSVNLLSNAVLAFILYRATLWYYKPSPHLTDTSLRFGKHLSIANIISTATAQADSILVFHFLGAEALALYAFASTLPERGIGVLKSISIIALPRFSEREPSVVRVFLVRNSLRFAALTVVVMGVYILAAPYIFALLFPEYLGAVQYSQWYAAALCVLSLGVLPLTAFTATQHTTRSYVYTVSSSLLSLLALCVGAATYGILGVIAARAITGAVNYTLVLALFPKE